MEISSYSIPVGVPYLSQDYKKRLMWLEEKSTKFDIIVGMNLLTYSFVLDGADAEEVAFLYRLLFQ